MKKKTRKMTEEEKQKIKCALDEYFSKYYPYNNYDPVKEKDEKEFRSYLIEDDTPSEIKSLVKMCEDYIETKDGPPRGKGLSADEKLKVIHMMWQAGKNWERLTETEKEEIMKKRMKTLIIK
jgi:hypothetical protein